MKLLHSFLILFSTCYIACTNDNINKNQIDINLDEGQINQVFYSSFVDSIEYIPLETTDDCLIGKIRDIIISDSVMFILNDERSSIFIYDKNGKYLRKIMRKGDGPGEYGVINQMSYNKYRNSISISSNNLKIIEYDSYGNMKREFKTPHYITDLYCFDDGSYLLSRIQRIDKPDDLILLTDTIGNITKSILKRNPNYSIDASDNWDFTEFNNEIHFISPQIDNIIYCYNQDSLKEILNIKIKPEVPSRYHNKKPNIIGFEEYYYRTVYRESINWLNIIFWSTTKDLRVIIYNKIKNKYLVGNFLKNDIDNMKEGEFLSASKNNTFTGYIESENDNNPIIQILHLK